MNTILGTYPILNKQFSNIDEYGVERVTYVFTVKTSNASDYIPLKDDVYYGPIPTSSDSLVASSLNPDVSIYKVISVEQTVLNGGLTQVVAKTAGSRNVNSKPFIRVLSGYPLLFGLSGFVNIGIPNAYRGNGSTRLGFGVQVKFIVKADSDSEGRIFSLYSYAAMPSSFRGVLLPAPARSPFSWTDRTNALNLVAGNNQSYEVSNYFGYLPSEITFERIGGVSLFSILYAERGEYYGVDCSMVPPGESGNCQTNYLYNIRE